LHRGTLLPYLSNVNIGAHVRRHHINWLVAANVRQVLTDCY
jgi:hypothetical protein